MTRFSGVHRSNKLPGERKAAAGLNLNPVRENVFGLVEHDLPSVLVRGSV